MNFMLDICERKIAFHKILSTDTWGSKHGLSNKLLVIMSRFVAQYHDFVAQWHDKISQTTSPLYHPEASETSVKPFCHHAKADRPSYPISGVFWIGCSGTLPGCGGKVGWAEIHDRGLSWLPLPSHPLELKQCWQGRL
jgi:hypothetical protein